MPARSGELSERRARTRERLVNAATEVVAAQGFHSAPVDQIAKRAGLSIGALYSNFTSKDELLLAVFDGHVRWFQDRARATAQDPDLSGATAAWLRLTDEGSDQFLVFIEFWAYAVRKPKVRREMATRMTQMRAEIASALENRGTREGSTPALPTDLAALLALAVSRGLALERLVNPDAVPDETISQMLATFVS